MTQLGLTPPLFKAALGLLEMNLRQFCAECGVSLTSMSKFQSDPNTALSSSTITKVLSFIRSKGVKISEEGVSYIQKIEEFKGADGLKTLYSIIYETLQNGGEYKSFNVPSSILLSNLGADFIATHVKRMAQISGLSAKALACASDKGVERPFLHYKVLSNPNLSEAMIIFDGNIAFFKASEPEIIIQLQRDADLAQMCARFFDQEWQSADEMNFTSEQVLHQIQISS